MSREVLRHSNIEHIFLVDIDETVFDISRRYFPHIATGLDNEKVHLVAEDARAWVNRALEGNRNEGMATATATATAAGVSLPLEAVDLIVVDLTDFGSSDALHTYAFYASLHKLLKVWDGHDSDGDGDGDSKPGGSALVINLASLPWSLNTAIKVGT